MLHVTWPPGNEPLGTHWTGFLVQCTTEDCQCSVCHLLYCVSVKQSLQFERSSKRRVRFVGTPAPYSMVTCASFPQFLRADTRIVSLSLHRALCSLFN